MKAIFSILIFAALAFNLTAQTTNAVTDAQKISTLQATNFYDKEMIVTGKVAQVTVRPSVTFLNLDKPHPNSPFTVVIFHSHSSFYGDANALKGKSIEIRGKIKNYQGSPEIVLDNMEQLTVVGVTNLELFLKPKTENAPPTSPTTTTNAPPANQKTNFPEIM